MVASHFIAALGALNRLTAALQSLKVHQNITYIALEFAFSSHLDFKLLTISGKHLKQFQVLFLEAVRSHSDHSKSYPHIIL